MAPQVVPPLPLPSRVDGAARGRNYSRGLLGRAAHTASARPVGGSAGAAPEGGLTTGARSEPPATPARARDDRDAGGERREGVERAVDVLNDMRRQRGEGLGERRRA